MFFSPVDGVAMRCQKRLSVRRRDSSEEDTGFFSFQVILSRFDDHQCGGPSYSDNQEI